MYELIKLTENNYYIESPAKIGLVKLNESDVAIIDSGNDKDASKKIKRILDEHGWNLKMILNTHSHADHIGGNQHLQKQTGCKIYAPGIECDFTCHPILEPSFIYGGYPINELKHKFIFAQPSNAEPLTEDILPSAVKAFSLPGHSFDMVGFKTEENVIYLADCLSSRETLKKYKIVFLVDVASYLETLNAVKKMQGIFVPSHAEITESISDLAQLNIDSVMEIGETISLLCKNPIIFEELLQKVFEIYSLNMTFEQYALIGSTVKSYLSWLKNIGKVEVTIENNRMLWRKS